MRAAVVVLLVGGGCHPKVRRAFEARLDTTLAPIAAVDDDWQPDATLQLATDVVADGLEASLLGGRFTTSLPVDGLVVRPSLTLRDLVLDLATVPCSGCTGVVARFAGTVALPDREVGVSLDARADVELSAVPEGDAVGLRLRPERVVDVVTRWDGVPPPSLLRADTDPVGRWVARRWEDELPAVRLGRLGRVGMPVAAATISRRLGGPLVDVRTGVAGATVAPPPRPDEGWSARIGVDTVLGLARRALLQRGPRDRLWADPTALTLTTERFELDLRLWRLAGWWVDLHVAGPVRVADGRVVLDPIELHEVGASKGARRLDPIEVVRQSEATRVLADAIVAVTPVGPVADIAGGAVAWRLTSLSVEGGVVTLRGDVALGEGDDAVTADATPVSPPSEAAR